MYLLNINDELISIQKRYLKIVIIRKLYFIFVRNIIIASNVMSYLKQ